MVGDNSDAGVADEEAGDGLPGAKDYSSPPCMLHELDDPFVEHPEQRKAPSGLLAPSAAQDWEDIRLWRRAKRTVLIDRRLAMPAEDRAIHSEAITTALVQVLQALRGELIGFYWPCKGEYDPLPLTCSLHGEGVRLALPVPVEKAEPLTFRRWWPSIPMTSGACDILIPAVGESVSPDILLVPLLGFDGRKYRLGYGGGHYDRALAALTAKPRAVGVGFELSRIATIHPQPHDIPMDIIVTERQTV